MVREQGCIFCGGNASEPDHKSRCDGRQGRVEAAAIVLRARGSDTETSHAAAADYDRETLAGAAQLVVWLHRHYGPLADFELQGHFKRHYQRACCDHLYRQARSAARDQGLIRDSAERRVNPTTNRRQVVWEACDDQPVVVARCGACGHVLGRAKA